MSRGPGKVQRFVLDRLATAAEGEWLSADDLAAEYAGHILYEPTPAQRESVRRAIRKLAATGLVKADHLARVQTTDAVGFWGRPVEATFFPLFVRRRLTPDGERRVYLRRRINSYEESIAHDAGLSDEDRDGLKEFFGDEWVPMDEIRRRLEEAKAELAALEAEPVSVDRSPRRGDDSTFNGRRVTVHRGAP